MADKKTLDEIKLELYEESIKYSLSIIKEANKNEEEVSSGILSAINGLLKFTPIDMKPVEESVSSLFGEKLKGLLIDKDNKPEAEGLPANE